ncbi:hypothetical protein [Paracoccus saliphilus]|uniref:Uncharacterized protein n=1 Tax=Paracoccus saliphilus TaxID=405559 RepID=A0AA45W7R2_9RHOB|nr:hypothetical protein [Paracoccus saliphilus]WCR04789.1 hypothetical protein JHX88_08785 [Paracoccus saliphilus]SIT11312.1 hypothetical protein SAMN05421772_11959 [Paracoccus saliphilus]
MEERIVTRHAGRSTRQGPESEAPGNPLPIDLPAVEDHEVPSPLQSIKACDLIYIAVGMFGTFAGGALAAWWLK